jgi:catechol-2,3-dioxygenase
MEKLFLDHLVISTTNFKKSTKFYQSFLGKGHVGKEDVCWQFGTMKLFITFPYKKDAKPFDKHNIGLNHLAFGVTSLSELKKYERRLNKAKIKHSGIQIDKYSNKEFIWFDDPDGIRLEFYLRV